MNFSRKTLLLIAFAWIFLLVGESAVAADNSASYRSYTRPSRIQWVLQKAFGYNFNGSNLGRTSGIRRERMNFRQATGVTKGQNIRSVVRQSTGINNISRVLGSRKNIFGGTHRISGFRKAKKY